MKETKKQKEKIAKVMHEFKEGELHIGKSDKIVKNPKQAVAIALSQAKASKKMADGGGVESSFNSTKKGLEGKDQQHRIDELINVVKKNNWSSKPLTVESGVVKTYAKMYDLEPIRVASIFNKYQKPKYAKGGGVGEAVKIIRKQDFLSKKREDKIKWFDKLPLSEKQELFYSYKRKKISLDQFLKDNDKVAIWNKVHNGSYTQYAKGGDINSNSSYETMLRKYDQLGAKLEDAIDEKNTNEVVRLKSEMNALESKINNYERGGSSFTYTIGGL